MELIIDKFEGKYVVCEDENKRIINIKKEDVVGDVKEGDILIFSNGKYIVNKEKTLNRKEYIKNLTKDLWE